MKYKIGDKVKIQGKKTVYIVTNIHDKCMYTLEVYPNKDSISTIAEGEHLDLITK